MNIEQLRDYCMRKKGANESFPFDSDTLVFKVMNKAFLLTSLSAPTSFNVKCDPEEAIAQREEYAEIEPGYHMNKKHWNTVRIDGDLSDAFLAKLIDDSYALVVAGMSKKEKLELEELDING